MNGREKKFSLDSGAMQDIRLFEKMEELGKKFDESGLLVVLQDDRLNKNMKLVTVNLKEFSTMYIEEFEMSIGIWLKLYMRKISGRYHKVQQERITRCMKQYERHTFGLLLYLAKIDETRYRAILKIIQNRLDEKFGISDKDVRAFTSRMESDKIKKF